MDRFPIIITLGAALLGFLAGEMFVTDPATKAFFEKSPDAHMWTSAICAVIVVVIGTWLSKRNKASAAG